jgi:DNA-binding NtrC family response regulator
MRVLSDDTAPAMSSEVEKAKQRFSIIGNSTLLLRAIERAVKVAPIDLSVLVTGESGSGKEFFPKIIHQFGSRKHKKYIAVNCGAIPEGTIDSELFGHEKGSFTGAISARKGYFEEADGGTIFLDEVAELPLTTQARLLRVLESGEFLKVGSSAVQKTDIRIVAATNVDLQKAVAKGKFREDLYYRLSTVQIQVPSLHDRGDDIILLARKFARDFSEKYMTSPITFGDDVRRLMLTYNWPGNVRQLKNVVEQLALFEAGQEVSREEMLELLPTNGFSTSAIIKKPETHNYETEREVLWQLILSMKSEIQKLHDMITSSADGDNNIVRSSSPLPILNFVETSPYSDAGQTLEDSEKDTIVAALERNGGSKKRAAAELNISERTLYRKIRDYNLDKYTQRPLTATLKKQQE